MPDHAVAICHVPHPAASLPRMMRQRTPVLQWRWKERHMTGKASKEPRRCPWSEGVSEAYLDYHDTEWGVPVHDDRVQFEFLILEGAQAGLSWRTILHRRAGYGRAFAGFDPRKVARFTPARIERLLQDPGIIRNRLKVESAVSNARAFLELQAAEGSFSRWLWSFVDGRPVVNRWTSQARVPATSTVSDAVSKSLKKRGFRFVGSTVMYAHLQATGLVNDHLIGCFRHAECRAAGRR
jgi:DNA-3-methyladenine glycosylase I